jgi:hypothetical protein
LPTLPGSNSVSYVTSRTAISAYQLPTSRWVVNEAASFELSGGATETSRTFVPFQYGPRLALSMDHRATRRDHVGASADASFSHFSTGADVGLATTMLRYGRDLARGTTIGFGAGPAGAAFRVQPDGYHTRVYANAEITVAHHRAAFGNRLDLDGAIRFSPIVDRIAATVDPRISASIAGTYTTRAYLARLSTSFVQSVLTDSSAAITAFGVEATLRIPLTRAIALDGGTRVALQSFQGSAFASYGFFLALDLHPDVLHFRTD